MADGNWIFGGGCRRARRSDQRQALAAIVGGEAGGTPAVIRQNLVSDFRGIAFQPIEFDDRRASTSRPRSPASSSFEIEGVASRNRSGDPSTSTTPHTRHRRLALARSKKIHVHGFGLDLDSVGQGNNGHFAPFVWAA